MRTLIAGSVLAAALFLAGFSLAGGDTTVKLTARLDAAQEVPAPKGAHGTGVFTATLAGRALTWRLTFSRLTGKAVAAHVHLGRQRVAGPVVIPLCGPCISGRARQGHHHREGAHRAARRRRLRQRAHGEERGRRDPRPGRRAARCHARAAEDLDVRDDDERRLRLLEAVALLFPVVGVVVVAVPLPEAGPVVLGQLDPA